MLPDSHPLIEAITEPLADNVEMKLSVALILEQTYDPEHPSVPQAIERLEARDKKKFPALGIIVLWVLAVAILGLAIHSDLRSILAVANVHDVEPLEDIKLPPQPIKYTQQEQLFLDDPEIDDLTEKKSLFESDPKNPAYFAEYALEYYYEHRSLPPDFLETAERIDPDNAFFVYWAAGVAGRRSVERSRTNTVRPPERIVDGVKLRPLPREQEYTIKDPAAYEEALDLIKEASDLPKFRTYTNLMMAAKARYIMTDNFVSYESGYDFYGSTIACGVLSMYGVFEVFSARAEELSKSGNEEEFLLLAAQHRALLSGLAHNEDINSSNEYNYWIIAYVTVINFHAAAERLGLSEAAENYRKQKEAFVDEQDYFQIRAKKSGYAYQMESASALNVFSYRPNNQSIRVIPPHHDSYLKPMRIVEHELLGRFGILMVSLLLMLGALVVFLFRFLTTKAICLPAKRIASLLKVTDWIWIFSLGIVLPILVFLLISRLSPVSGRDYSCSHFEFAFPGIHLMALLLTLLLAPAIITRWRLTRRSAAFQFGSHLDLLSLPVIAVMLVYSIVAYPYVILMPRNDMTRFGLSLPLLGWLAFVFFNGLRIFLGSARSRLIQTATAIAVLPAYPLAILALCLTLPLYIRAERQGLAEDKNIFIHPETSELGAYEYKVAAQKRKEINAILEF